jgi:putative transposase
MIESVSKRLRLAGRDYSAPGWYFVTLGADFHKPLFGCMEESKVILNDWGRLVVKAWHDLPNHCVDVQLGEFIVMPNHVHGLLRLGPANKLPLGAIINGLKGQVTRNVNKLVGKRCTVWQQNYHEVIVHGLEELKAKAAYIKENPERWALNKSPRQGGAAPARGIINNPLPGQSTPKGEAVPMRYAGNVDLLELEPKLALRVSRRASEGEIEALKQRMRSFEGVVASTFISPGERECLEVLLNKGTHVRVLWVIPMAMPEHIYAQWAGAFTEGRALWVSAYGTLRQGEALPGEPPAGAGHSLNEPSRERCMECNSWVEELCKTPAPGRENPSLERGTP